MINKNEWITAHLDQLQKIQDNPRQTEATLQYGELVDEFYDLFHESLTESLEAYSKEN